MTYIGARQCRRAVLGLAVGGLALAALAPRIGVAAPYQPVEVQAITFDGGTPLIAGDGLWRLQTRGWEPVAPDIGQVTALAVHQGGRLFAGTASGDVLLSEDGGANWAETGKGLPGAPVTALAIAATDPQRIYAAIEGDGLWTSPDSGESWEFAMDRPFIDGAERELLTLASVNAQTGMGGIWIYAGTEAGLTRLPDCFCRWQDVQPGDAMDALASGEALPERTPLPEGEPVQSLSTTPQDGSVIYAGLPSGIWKTTDAGVNWSRLSDTPARLVAVDPTNPQNLVAVTEGGILTSRDGGLTWTAPGA